MRPSGNNLGVKWLKLYWQVIWLGGGTLQKKAEVHADQKLEDVMIQQL